MLTRWVCPIVVFRYRAKIFSKPPVGGTIDPISMLVSANPTPYTLVFSGVFLYLKKVLFFFLMSKVVSCTDVMSFWHFQSLMTSILWASLIFCRLSFNPGIMVLTFHHPEVLNFFILLYNLQPTCLAKFMSIKRPMKQVGYGRTTPNWLGGA